ncbi:hypothetical protein [Rhizobium rhizosphaerae]|uniref:hypothetical protein n=1 Tax=Xaviernesmea rhizosphaerae TaxID=1672749 RepID=UPI001594AF9E|nr:hypothetical protein [Xaviernesmea rhizosphaerae]
MESVKTFFGVVVAGVMLLGIISFNMSISPKWNEMTAQQRAEANAEVSLGLKGLLPK